VVSVIVPPGDQYRAAVQGFQAAYPGVQLEIKGEHMRDTLPRILQEREAGIYVPDVIIGGLGAGVFQEWIPRSVLAPLATGLVLPELTDDSKWMGGLATGYMDTANQYVYAFLSNVTRSVQVNRDFVSEQELPSPSSLDGLLDPRWKGKIVWDDPRELGSGGNFAAAILRARSEDYLKRLMQEQQVVASRESRQVVEWVVRGRYPIGFGLSPTILEGFRNEGLGRNVAPIEITGVSLAGPGFGAVSIFNSAPHPSAAMVFVNWLLSREGQTAYTSITADNSRRVDVPPGNPSAYPNADVDYLNQQKEEFTPIRVRAMQVAQEAIR
jgi:iron(III) transport system substrate-binding protein